MVVSELGAAQELSDPGGETFGFQLGRPKGTAVTEPSRQAEGSPNLYQSAEAGTA